jgi:hypothetical protein
MQLTKRAQQFGASSREFLQNIKDMMRITYQAAPNSSADST